MKLTVASNKFKQCIVAKDRKSMVYSCKPIRCTFCGRLMYPNAINSANMPFNNNMTAFKFKYGWVVTCSNCSEEETHEEILDKIKEQHWATMTCGHGNIAYTRRLLLI